MKKSMISFLYKIQNTKHKIRKFFCRNNSFTLIETLIVAAILIIMTTGAVLEMSSFKNKKTLDLDAQQIATALGNAQSKAIQQEGGSAWGVRFTNGTVDSYQIFQGLSYSTSSVVDSEQLGLTDSFTNPASGMNLDVVFNQRTGTPVSGGAFVVVIKQNSSSNLYSIFVSSAGKISTIFETGLVGYWPMDEGSGGTAYDASGNNNVGTITIGASGTQTTVAQAWANATPSRVGIGLNFDGTDDYAWIADASANHLTSSFTFSAWINPSAYSSENIIFNKENTYEWAIDTTQNVRWAINNTTPGWNWISTGLSAPTSQWNYFVITYDGNSVLTYKNGVLGNTYSGASGSLVPNGNELLIGARGNTSPASFFIGKIDDVRIYNRALSATEIQNLYNSY